MSANDNDEGTNAEFSFSVENEDGSESTVFTIDAASGALRVASTVNAEEQVRHTLNITVTDHGIPPLASSVLVNITVDDVNEFHPVFLNDNITVEISEAIQAGEIIAHFYATDDDAGVNGRVKYRMLDNTAFFSLDADTGNVTLLAPFNIEDQLVHVLHLQAYDGGDNPPNELAVRTTNALLTVVVMDFNEFVPVFFATEYSCTIPEHSPVNTPCAVVSAADFDFRFNDISYSLSGTEGAPVAIDAASGAIFSTAELDYDSDEPRVYYMQVLASDNGDPQPLQASVNLTVFIADINDGVPVLSPGTLSTSVIENFLPTEPVAVLHASDSDSGVNSELVFSIISANGVGSTPRFNVTSSGGDCAVWLMQPFDREALALHTIQIVARDRGTPTRTSNVAVVSITVLDANDHQPVFDLSNQNAALGICEESLWIIPSLPVDSPLLYVTASDEDTGLNAAISYTLRNEVENPYFKVNEDTGLISTRIPLSGATASVYVLHIKATDQAPVVADRQSTTDVSPATACTPGQDIVVEIAILDTDAIDLIVFDVQPYVFSIDEGAAIPPMRIRAMLLQSTKITNYTIVSGNVNNTWRLNTLADGRCEIVPTTSDPLLVDTLGFAAFHLEIAASYSAWGIPLVTTAGNVTILVKDLTDAPPTLFPRSGIVRLDEIAVPDVVLLSFNVSTIDFNPAFQTFSASLFGTASNMFRLNQTSASTVDLVTATDGLYPVGTDIVVTIKVEDGGGADYANVTVVINDINNHAPTFHEFTCTISEGLPVGQVCLDGPWVTDADVGENAKISFSLFGGSEYFAIDPANGTLYNTIALDTVLHGTTFVVTVGAIDHGTPQLQNASTVTVTVQPQNLHAPVFTQSVFFTQHDMGYVGVLGAVSATDKDNGADGTVSYALGPLVDPTLFSISASTGVLFSSSAAALPVGPDVTVDVVAYDGGAPIPKNSSATMIIQVHPVNVHRPTFAAATATCQFADTDPIGWGCVTNIVATDTDDGVFGDVYYILQQPSARFALQNNTAVLFLQQAVDIGAQSVFILYVMAVDGGGLTSSSMVELTVTVASTDVRPPQVRVRYIFR